ncbi:MAG: DUF805 domain-containing protein [Solirubrobacterales bacterium]
MTFGEAIKDGFDHYVKFDGRASRPAFWWWLLFVVLVSIAANIIDAGIFEGTVLTWIVGLALFLPGLSVSIRRLHDTNRTGWWVLISFIPIIGFIVLLIFYIQESDPGENQYGPPPAAAPATG